MKPLNCGGPSGTLTSSYLDVPAVATLISINLKPLNPARCILKKNALRIPMVFPGFSRSSLDRWQMIPLAVYIYIYAYMCIYIYHLYMLPSGGTHMLPTYHLFWAPETTSWWFFPTHLKNMFVKMGSSSPIFGMKISKNV